MKEAVVSHKLLYKQKLEFEILGTPGSKQSARFAVMNGRVRSYQKKELVQKEQTVSFDIKSQLPKDYIPYDGPIGYTVTYIFLPPKSWSKKKLLEVETSTVYKESKPDLQDNLNKMLFDAMTSVVYTDDARVCHCFGASKIYGNTPKTILTIYLL